MTGGPCAVLLRVRVLDEPDTQSHYSTLVCEALAEHVPPVCPLRDRSLAHFESSGGTENGVQTTLSFPLAACREASC
jgi:hypothetical protein